jgi:hypothetical protein
MLKKIFPTFLLGAIFMLVLHGSVARAQVVHPDVPDASQSSSQRQRDVDSPWVVQQKREIAKKQNEARQQDIKKDTDKLLALATELKQYVDKTNENILSMDVVKKAEEIEKLAHAVREKMKGP